jgi:hypothetical protein
MAESVSHKIVANEVAVKRALMTLAISAHKSVEMAQEEITQSMGSAFEPSHIRLLLGVLAVQSQQIVEGSNASMHEAVDKMYESLVKHLRNMDGGIHQIKKF